MAATLCGCCCASRCGGVIAKKFKFTLPAISDESPVCGGSGPTGSCAMVYSGKTITLFYDTELDSCGGGDSCAWSVGDGICGCGICCIILDRGPVNTTLGGLGYNLSNSKAVLYTIANASFDCLTGGTLNLDVTSLVGPHCTGWPSSISVTPA